MNDSMSSKKPLILLVFANDKTAYLEGITKERKNLLELLNPAVAALNYEIKSLDYSSIESLLDALNTDNKRIFLIHFAGHSGADFLNLDKGTVYSGGIAKKLKKCSNLKLVFLNGCNNISLVKSLKEVNIPFIIGTKSPISDHVAKKFSNYFFAKLVIRKMDIHDAYQSCIDDLHFEENKIYRSIDLSNYDKDWFWLKEFSSVKWKFADEADYCNRLPVLSKNVLPRKPFKSFHYYREEDASIFFGRCKEIFEVLSLIESMKEPVIIIHGRTGVGKSSFIYAGLIPRLDHYEKITNIFSQRLVNYDSITSLIDEAIEKIEPKKNTGCKTVWIIDQFEELFNNPKFQKEKTKEIFSYKIKKILNNNKNLKLIVCLRKEWFSEIYDLFLEKDIDQCSYMLKSLTRKSIKEIVNSISNLETLKKKYNLKIEEREGNLSDLIANDILIDEDSTIAPMLQIILYHLWRCVEYNHDKVWNIKLYNEEKKNGLLLEDHFKRQINNIYKQETWGKEVSENGLLLDILSQYATPQMTTSEILYEDFEILYSHISYRYEILNALINSYLLIEVDKKNPFHEPKTRLAHDILSNIVINNYTKSNLPGQLSRRILENKISNKIPSLLNPQEIRVCEIGLNGMSMHNRDNYLRIIRKSKIENSRIKNIRNTSYLLISLIFSCLFTFLLWSFFVEKFRKEIIMSPIKDSWSSLRKLSYICNKKCLWKTIESTNEEKAVYILQSAWEEASDIKINYSVIKKIYPEILNSHKYPQWLGSIFYGFDKNHIPNKYRKYFLNFLYEKIPNKKIYKKSNSVTLQGGKQIIIGCDPKYESPCTENAKPLSIINLDQFSILKHEVTNIEYQNFYAPHKITTSNSQTPVVNINWYEAYAYSTWVGGKLPTEAQWEYAARGDFKRRERYPDEGIGIDIGDREWLDENTDVVQEVMTKQPSNNYGLFDMQGNVAEWCLDNFSNSGDKVVKGGTFKLTKKYAKSSKRTSIFPLNKFDSVGFRVVFNFD